MLWIIYTCLAIATVLAVLYLYAFIYEPANFKLSNVDIFIKENLLLKTGENKSGRPILTILHLSDFHLRKNSKGKKLFNFVRSLDKLSVDFILITGDLLDSDRNIEYLIEMLSPLRAKYGKYAVFGVHDHYNKALIEFTKNMFKRKKRYKRENDTACIVKRLKGIGIEVLINESRKVNINNNGINDIEIIGLDDPIVKKIDIIKAFKQINGQGKLEPITKSDYRYIFRLKKEKVHKINTKGKLRIILMHTPDTDSIINLARKKTDIMFSGHTHGGQVRLPLVGAVISGCKIKAKFASGLFYFRSFVLYVTRGLGEGKYSQFRFLCQPEASLVKIYKLN